MGDMNFESKDFDKYGTEFFRLGRIENDEGRIVFSYTKRRNTASIVFEHHVFDIRIQIFVNASLSDPKTYCTCEEIAQMILEKYNSNPAYRLKILTGILKTKSEIR